MFKENYNTEESDKKDLEEETNTEESAKKDLEKKAEEIPEDLFKEKLFVIYNKFKRFGDENDELFQITDRRYGQVYPGDIDKTWCYVGTIFKMRKINSKGLPEIPRELRIIYDVPQDNLMSCDEIATY